MSINASTRMLVSLLLQDQTVMLSEATVKLPSRGSKWLVVFTAAEPGKQVWKSTGLTGRDAALVKALGWEAQARRQRAVLGLKPRKPNIRVRRTRTGPSGSIAPGVGPLSQLEVAAVLKLSVRAVRSIERRALGELDATARYVLAASRRTASRNS